MESFDNAGLESMTVTLFEQAATEDVKHIEEIVNSVRDYMIALNDAIVRLIPDQVLTGWSLDLLENWNKCYNGSIQDAMREMSFSAHNLQMAIDATKEFSKSNKKQ